MSLWNEHSEWIAHYWISMKTIVSVQLIDLYWHFLPVGLLYVMTRREEFDQKFEIQRVGLAVFTFHFLLFVSMLLLPLNTSQSRDMKGVWDENDAKQHAWCPFIKYNYSKNRNKHKHCEINLDFLISNDVEKHLYKNGNNTMTGEAKRDGRHSLCRATSEWFGGEKERATNTANLYDNL